MTNQEQDQALINLYTEILKEQEEKEFSECCGAPINDDEGSCNYGSCTNCEEK